MDTLHLTTKPDSETAATKPGKTDRDGQPAGKVDSGEKKPTTSTTPKAPAAKRDWKVAPVTTDAPVTVTDTEPAGEEDSTVTTEVPEPTAEDPTATTEVTVTTAKDPEPNAQEPEVSDSTPESSTPTVTEPKKPTKADLAKAIYDEAVKGPQCRP